MNYANLDLGQLVQGNVGQPYQLSLDLTQTFVDMEFNIAGRVIAIWNAPTSVEYITIRFNRRDADSIRFNRGKVLAVPFTKLYITVPVTVPPQAGTMEILFGPDAFEVLRIYPQPPEYDAIMDDILTELQAILAEAVEFTGHAQPVIMITNVAADANTVGADHDCTAVLIRALTTNTGLVWVNWAAAAVDGTSYPLDAGDAVSVKTTNTDQINCLFKVGGESVAVVYQN